MSVEGISGESAEAPVFYDGEVGLKDRINETITGFAQQILRLQTYFVERVKLTVSPFHPGEYGQKGVFQESCIRVARLWVSFCCLIGTTVFSIFASGVTAVGNYFHSTPFKVMKGTFSGEVGKDPKTLLLNPRMYSGLTPQKLSGLSLPGDRYECLLSTILDNNPDVLFLPEVNRFVAPYLTQDLKDRYNFFFSGMGERPIGEDASIFIGFRGKLTSEPEYIPSSKFDLLQGKGHMILETENRIYACVYLPTKEDWEKILNRECGEKELVIMGEGVLEDASHLKEKGFSSLIPEDAKPVTTAPYAHYHKLEEEVSPSSFPLYYMNDPCGKTDVVPMHDEGKISEALSDHSMILHR